MPFYDYFCETCEKEFEVKQSIKDPPLDKCPECLKNGVDTPPPKKLISKSSFILVGGCWAKDNYSGK